jgi:hypothetical protein
MILLISYDMIVVETVCLWTIVVCYCGGCDPLVVTVCHYLVAMYTRSGCVPLDSSCILLQIDTVVFYWMALF